ncbi:MAG: hypothetical protein IKV67_11625 [Paludibacteraceae bacterium]|nr:hypothetical protein [Paludibacteraceae bacterium]
MNKTLKFVAALGLFLSATGCVNNEQKKNDNVDGLNSAKIESVDLGLTSGTKWASCNVGADSPEKYGEYFAWGETVSKEVYSDTTYSYYLIPDSVAADSSAKKVWKNIGSDIAGTEYDAATVVLGDAWQLPNESQCKELVDECEWTWTEMNGVNGYKVVGKNGNSIFLPASGVRGAADVVKNDMIGGFWSSTLCDAAETSGDFAMAVYFFSESRAVEKGGRWMGRAVRAVAK